MHGSMSMNGSNDRQGNERSHRAATICLIASLAVGMLAVAECMVIAAPGDSVAVERRICRIEIVDAANGWPVPMVELRSNHHVRLVSDNAGVIALDLPELMGVESWFTVIGHGYEVPRDGFGFQGIRLIPQRGERIVIKLTRKLPAKRVGRLTGAGLYAESQKFGEYLDVQESRVFGCDSVQMTVHGGQRFWAWGDTTLGRYPLGRFHMTGAVSAGMPWGGYQPPIKPRYDIFRDDEGLPRNIGELPGDGPTWISGLASLPDRSGHPKMVGAYVKVHPPLEAYEAGLCVWDDREARFKRHRVLWRQGTDSGAMPPLPNGHGVTITDESGRKVVYFGDPFPHIRMEAAVESWENPKSWETLSPQKTVRGINGRDVEVHRGSIAWNPYRQRWIAVFTELGGEESFLGSVWYAESQRITGPWGAATKVAVHTGYSFYNPHLHTDLSGVGPSVIFFEGTYASTFSGNQQPTPRYDYNQVLYRLDLDELGIATD
jgi:hypothetical protein